MKKTIYYTKPSILEKEVKYATDAARNGWGKQCYAYIHRFEDLFRKYLGVKYAIATSSCTGALHMGLAALGIGSDDEVIMADTNWIASAAPVTYLGAKPVFVDILPDTWCIDPSKIEAAITSRTKAIIAVHLYGNLCEMDELLEIGVKYGIPVVEDAAEAIGSIYHGNRAGSIGKFGVFSFHGTKTITTGEGGIFVTDDLDLYNHVLTLSNHGRVQGQKKQFWPEMIGFKYKMSNIQAAIGCAQMERIDDIVRRKREVYFYYQNALCDLGCVTMNPEPEGVYIGAWMPTVVFAKETHITYKKLTKQFMSENIDARAFFYPLSSLPSFRQEKNSWINKWSWDIPNRAINLPSYYDIEKEDMSRVVDVLSYLLKQENYWL